MLRLNLSNEPRWLDLGHGVRLLVEPLTTAIMLAARSDPTILAAAQGPEPGDERSNDNLARIVAKAVARIVVKDWEGVGGEDGKPLPITPEGIDALLEIWPVFEAFQTQYVARGLLLDQEKNASAPSPTGASAGATAIARPANPTRAASATAPTALPD